MKDEKLINPTEREISEVIKLHKSSLLDQAENLCKKLEEKYPNSTTLNNAFGIILLSKGLLEESLIKFDNAINLDKKFYKSYANKASALLGLGDLKQALKYYNSALAINSKFPEAHNNRGIVLQKLGKLDEAIESFQEAILLNTRYAEAYFNLGSVQQDLGLINNCIISYNKAIQLQPKYIEAIYNRAIALVHIGKKDEAIENFNQVIDLKPDFAEAHRNLSNSKHFTTGDQHIKQMEEMFSSALLSEDRMHLAFALSKAYDDLFDYDKGFYYLKQGNDFRKKELNVGDVEKIFKQIKEIFTSKSDLITAPPYIKQNTSPIFILGMPRSGTSLTEQILASHSLVHGAGELETMNKLARPILLDRLSKNSKDSLSLKEVFSLREGYLKYLKTLNTSKNIIVDKMPLNFRWVGFILSAFPKAKIIHIERDPMATCWSIYKHFFPAKGNAFAYDMVALAKYYNLYKNLMVFWNETFPDKIYNLNYEALTENQEQETRKLLEYCDLPWEKDCLEFYKNKRPVKTASASQVKSKMYQGSSNTWKNYEKHLQPLLEGLDYHNG